MTADRKQHIQKAVLIIVEGLDEHRLLLSQIRDKDEFAEVQVWNSGGKEAIPSQLELIKNDRHFKEDPGVRAVGIIRDADSNRAASDESLRSVFGKANLPVPSVQLAIAEGSPKTGYLLMPHDEESGCLEHACLKAFRFSDRLHCAEAFLDCKSKTYGKTTNQNHQAKVKVHAMIAGDDKKPAMTLGESASAGLWDFTHPSLKIMLDFIEMLVKA